VANTEVQDGDDAPRRSVRMVQPDDVLSPEEIARLLAHAEPGFFRTLFLTALLTGARHNELLALKWSDIDLEAGKLSIRRNLTCARVTGEAYRSRFYPPKTKSGNRTMPIAPELTHALKVWKLQCPPGELDLVFPKPDGSPMHHSNVLRIGLYPACRRAQLRTVGMHALRHTFASLLIRGDAPVNEVSHYLGHSNPAITLSIYTHWWKTLETQTITTLAKTVLTGTWTPSGHQNALAATTATGTES